MNDAILSALAVAAREFVSRYTAGGAYRLRDGTAAYPQSVDADGFTVHLSRGLAWEFDYAELTVRVTWEHLHARGWHPVSLLSAADAQHNPTRVSEFLTR